MRPIRRPSTAESNGSGANARAPPGPPAGAVSSTRPTATVDGTMPANRAAISSARASRTTGRSALGAVFHDVEHFHLTQSSAGCGRATRLGPARSPRRLSTDSPVLTERAGRYGAWRWLEQTAGQLRQPPPGTYRARGAIYWSARPKTKVFSGAAFRPTGPGRSDAPPPGSAVPASGSWRLSCSGSRPPARVGSGSPRVSPEIAADCDAAPTTLKDL